LAEVVWHDGCPITGIGGCCARVASGQTAAAPPRSVMNSRRCMGLPRRPTTTPYHIIVAWCITAKVGCAYLRRVKGSGADHAAGASGAHPIPDVPHKARPFRLRASGEFEYWIKSMYEPHERVAQESELHKSS
jgi:hypothetical protein